MALQLSGPISLNNVNVELGLSGTTTISLNQASVRTLFGIASGAIRMSDGYGKSNAVPPIIINDYDLGDNHVCEWNSWTKYVTVSGTRPLNYQLLQYDGGCGGGGAIDSGTTGGTGYVAAETISLSNYYAQNSLYPGKAANYRLRVYNSAGDVYSGYSRVIYGYCTTETTTTCVGTETCTEACCDVDCSADCISAYLCRAECDQSDYDNCNINGCPCWPTACGYDCTCSGYYDTVTQTVYQYDTHTPSSSCT